jgi:hypothetical protein
MNSYTEGKMNPTEMRPSLLSRIIRRINRKDWWHVPPQNPQAYLRRGKFLASSFAEAEFWGRPLDEPQKVTIRRPLVGDERRIERELFGKQVSSQGISVKRRWALDAKIKRVALAKGYDSIVLTTPKEFSAFYKSKRMPRSIELNILSVGSSSIRSLTALRGHYARRP